MIPIVTIASSHWLRHSGMLCGLNTCCPPFLPRRLHRNSFLSAACVAFHDQDICPRLPPIFALVLYNAGACLSFNKNRVAELADGPLHVRAHTHHRFEGDLAQVSDQSPGYTLDLDSISSLSARCLFRRRRNYNWWLVRSTRGGSLLLRCCQVGCSLVEKRSPRIKRPVLDSSRLRLCHTG